MGRRDRGGSYLNARIYVGEEAERNNERARDQVLQYTMGMIGEDDIRRVRDATDIVELIGERVVLRPRGRDFWGNCPFHNEKTPSFKVDPTSQFYHCFGCGEGGDAFKFTMKMENIDFPDAVRVLAQRKSIELVEEQGEISRGKKARLLAVCEETASFFHQQLMRVKSTQSDAAREYLKGRGMGGEIARVWKIGFAPGMGKLVKHLSQKGFSREDMIDANVVIASEAELRDRFYNRIIFPISDLQGRTIAFGGRILGQGEPKYLNSADTILFHKRDNLYAINKAKPHITVVGSAIVVEGYTDVIAMHETGFTNTVATLGTALTPEHLKLLARFTTRVVLLFDGDEAGLRAADRSAELINVIASPVSGRKADVFVAMLPGSMDPADFCAQKGREEMRKVLDGAIPLLRFAIDRRLKSWDLSKPEQRARALEDVVRLLVPIKGSLLATDYTNYLADVLAVEYRLVASTLDKAKPLAPLRASGSAGAAGATGVSGAAGATGAVAPTSLESALRQSGDQTTALESELLFLFIEHPEVRERISEAFRRIVWSAPEHESVARVLLTLDAEDEPEAMLSKLIARMPSASGVLSGTRLSGVRDIPPNRLAGMLMFSIREGQLKKTIRIENARLRLLDKEQRPEQWDELFKHVANLQMELSDLRRKYRSE